MARVQSKLPTQRQLRVGEILRHAMARIIERETFQDPALLDITLTVTEVETSADLKHATVYVTRLGGGDMSEILIGLKRVKSFLRRRLSTSVQLRFVPDLYFAPDKTFDQAEHIDALLSRPEVARDLARNKEVGLQAPLEEENNKRTEYNKTRPRRYGA